MLLDGNDMLLGGNDMLLGGGRDLLADALLWVPGHCRLITTNLPHWTLWIVHLLDEKMLAKIKKLTPPSQL